MEGGGEGGEGVCNFCKLIFLGVILAGIYFLNDNATLKPHEYFKVGVQAYCGVIDCYMPIYVS